MPYNSKNKSGAEAELLSDKWLGGKNRDYCQRNTASKERKKEQSLKRVVAYCRVSTKTQEQLDSLIPQKNYYESKIKANPDSQFADIYPVGNRTTILEIFPIYEESRTPKTAHLS